MAYALPTIAAVVNGGANPKTGQAFNIALTMTSTGTVGVKLRRVMASQISGPGVVIGSVDMSSRTSTEGSGGAIARVLPTGLHYAGTNQPSDADYRANAGSSATTTVNVEVLAKETGVVVLKFIAVVTRDDTGEEVQVICADTSITVE